MSLLLPDHDTKGSCAFKVGGRDPDAGRARAPSHSDPLHPVPGDGGWFQRGPGGSFRLDEPRPPLHSHRVGTATLRWLADAHLEVRRRLVNSLLERLRRRLRELGRPLSEAPPSEGGRHPAHAHAGDAPQRRTEIEPTSQRQCSDRSGTGQEARLPAQQPPPPSSTRLKAAVFSKKRLPSPQRHSGTIWGPTSYLDCGSAAIGEAKPEWHPLVLSGVTLATAGTGSSSTSESWTTQPAPASLGHFATSADFAQYPWRIQEQPEPTRGIADTFMSTLSPAVPVVGATALGPNMETPQYPSQAFPFALDGDLGSWGPSTLLRQ